MSDTEETLAAVGGLVVGLVLVGCGLSAGLLWAKVTTDLWRWFVQPPFGAPALHFWNAYGLLLLAVCFTHGLARRNAEDESGSWRKRALTQTLASVIGALFTWGVGAIAAGYAQ